MLDLLKELARAEHAAREAGDFLRAAFFDNKTVLSEEGRDIKLQADRDAETIILKILAESPYPVLAEESGEVGDIAPDSVFWIVDPLDGTMNYNRGIPMCCVSVALCKGEEPLLGVIYDFNRNECFRGAVGEGAWFNDSTMAVSGERDRSRCILATGFPTHRDFTADSLADFIRMAETFKKVRMLGSAALMTAYVACGRVDAYMEDDIMFWDVAAGVALVNAAGGYVSLAPGNNKKWGRIVRCSSDAAVWDE